MYAALHHTRSDFELSSGRKCKSHTASCVLEVLAAAHRAAGRLLLPCLLAVRRLPLLHCLLAVLAAEQRAAGRLLLPCLLAVRRLLLLPCLLAVLAAAHRAAGRLPPETAVAVPKLALKELDCTLRTNSACTAVA